MLSELNYNLWALWCIVSAGLIFNMKPFSRNRIYESRSREYNIDGLRYVLAAMVAFQHKAFFFNLYKTGIWSLDYHIPFYIGKFAVSIFFIISGYILGNVSLHGKEWGGFYIKRFLRIAPMTYVSSLACILISTCIGIYLKNPADFHLVFFWFDAGLTLIRPPVYGFDNAHLINAGVTWSLMWEWWFYFSLPILSIPFLKTRKLQVFALVLVALATIYAVALHFGLENGPHAYNRYSVLGPVYVTLFCLGCIIRQVKERYLKTISIPRKMTDCLSLALLFVFLVIGYTHDPLTIPFAFAYGLFFLCFACGANWFGLLQQKGVILLGDASYSIYLLHGIGWFLMDMFCFHFKINQNIYLYYTFMTLGWYMICYISIKTFETVEIPFIRLGSRITRNMNLAPERHS
ncbi:acyltransferase [Komagataeibacter kakiaceti JCM 25156]